jgi:hypothetical protein
LDCMMVFARESLHGRKQFPGFAVALTALSGVAVPAVEGAKDANDTPAPTILDWDVILREFNRAWDRMVDADAKQTFWTRSEAFVAIQAEMRKLREAVRERARQGSDPNGSYLGKLLNAGPEGRAQASKEMGDFLEAALVPGLCRASDLRDRAVTRLDLSKVSLALAAYRAEKGDFPDALAALAPAYIREVPKDLFTDGPLVYRKTATGFLLYSLGPNMKDDGGKTLEEDAENFDIVVKVE